MHEFKRIDFLRAILVFKVQLRHHAKEMLQDNQGEYYDT